MCFMCYWGWSAEITGASASSVGCSFSQSQVDVEVLVAREFDEELWQSFVLLNGQWDDQISSTAFAL